MVASGDYHNELDFAECAKIRIAITGNASVCRSFF
jgi:hypothetical protein